MRPSFGLPVASSPGTPFFPFFPFFSSLFVFCFGRRKWRIPEQLRRRGEAEPRATAASFSFFSFLSSLFFFFLFWPSKMEESGAVASSGRGGAAASSESARWGRRRQPNPKRRRFGWCDFFFKIKTPQNDVVLRLMFF